MKRYVRLLAITLSLVILLGIISYFTEDSSKQLNMVKIEKTEMNNTLTCSGRVEGGGRKEIKVSLPVVFKEIHVSSGDSVKEGDLIATVDKTQSVSLIMSTIESLSSLSSLESLAAFAGLGDINLENLSVFSIPDEIRAPASGVISEWNVQGNTFTNINAPLCAVSDSTSIQIKIPISESRISSVKKGQYVIVNGTGFKKKYFGKINKIADSARQELKSGTGSETVVDVFVTITKTGKDLKPGFSATAKILTESLEPLLIVPFQAVCQDSENREYVYVYRNSKTEKQIIETGEDFEEGFEVLSGLSEGDWVITNPEQINKT